MRAAKQTCAASLAHSLSSSCALGRTIRVQHGEGRAKVTENPRKHAADFCPYEANTGAVAELVHTQRISQRRVCEHHHLNANCQPVTH